MDLETNILPNAIIGCTFYQLIDNVIASTYRARVTATKVSGSPTPNHRASLFLN